jgi:hypothetical protein
LALTKLEALTLIGLKFFVVVDYRVFQLYISSVVFFV